MAANSRWNLILKYYNFKGLIKTSRHRMNREKEDVLILLGREKVCKAKNDTEKTDRQSKRKLKGDLEITNFGIRTCLFVLFVWKMTLTLR